MKQKATFEEVKQVVSMLRGENGCPWDKAQTLDSLSPCLLDESAEVIAALKEYRETGQPFNLCEELGDLLFVLLLYGQIAEDEQLFTMEEVMGGIKKKMIGRHPHVFGSAAPFASQTVESKNWKEAKKKEKELIPPEILDRRKQLVIEAENEISVFFQSKK